MDYKKAKLNVKPFINDVGLLGLLSIDFFENKIRVI